MHRIFDVFAGEVSYNALHLLWIVASLQAA